MSRSSSSGLSSSSKLESMICSDAFGEDGAMEFCESGGDNSDLRTVSKVEQLTVV